MEKFILKHKFRLTIGWVVVVGLCVIYWGFVENNISLSKGGDFLSGAISPLAIFWLVLIYRQQQEEMGKFLTSQGKTSELLKIQHTLDFANMQMIFIQSQIIYLSAFIGAYANYPDRATEEIKKAKELIKFGELISENLENFLREKEKITPGVYFLNKIVQGTGNA